MTQQLCFVFTCFWLWFDLRQCFAGSVASYFLIAIRFSDFNRLHILCSSAIVDEVSRKGFVCAQNVTSFERAILRCHHATENFNFNHDDYPANLLGWPD